MSSFKWPAGGGGGLVGAIADTSTIDLDITLSTLTANINPDSITDAMINSAAAISYSKLALTDSIVNADINSAAAIAYSKLALTDSIVNADINSAAAIAYSKLALTDSIVNADINSAAAIAYSKLNLAGSIVDADINASAAIAGTKIDPDFGAQAITTTSEANSFGNLTLTKYGFDISEEFLEVLDTGIYNGLTSGYLLQINGGDNTTFDIGAFSGHIMDWVTNPTTPAYYDIDYAGSTGNTVTNLATADITYVYINNAGSIVQSTTRPTNEDLKNKIFLGRLVHSNRTNIVSILNQPTVVTNPLLQFRTYAEAKGLWVVDGGVATPDGANLKFDINQTKIFNYGTNVINDYAEPNVVTIAAKNQAAFQYIDQDTGGSGVDVTDIVPGSYDNAGTVTAIPGATTRATNQRIYLFPSGNVRVAYGQVIYNSLSAAAAAAGQENSFVTNPLVPGNGVLIGILSVTSGATDLSDPAQAIFQVARDVEGVIAGTSYSAATLQDVYDNSATQPQITLDSTNGGVVIADAATPIGADLLKVVDNAETSQFLKVDVNGVYSTAIVAGGTLNASAILQADSTSKGFLPPRMTEAQRDAIGTPATGLVVYNTDINKLNFYNGTAWSSVGGGSENSTFTGTSITVSNEQSQKFRYTGGSAQSLATLTFTDLPDGGRLIITGSSDTNTLTIPTGLSNVRMNGERVLYNYSTIEFIKDGTQLIEVSRNGI